MLLSNNWQPIVRFFKKMKEVERQELSDPVPVRMPVAVLEEVTNQAAAIGGDRYRSRHLADLIELGTKFYRINSDRINALPLEHINLIMRLHYVFNELDLQAEKVAEALGHENLEQVATWMNGSVVPSFADLTLFAETFFINEEWLKYGNRSPDKAEFTPFFVETDALHQWERALKQILVEYKGKAPSFIKLIRSDSGDLLVSMEYGSSELVRSIYYSNVRLRSESDVGAGGFSDLVNLAILCLVLYKHIHTGPIISYSVSDEDMELLKNGEKLPKQIGVDGQNKANVWYESIFDRDDTDKTSPCWKGSHALFRAIQDSTLFANYKEEFEKDPRAAIQYILGS